MIGYFPTLPIDDLVSSTVDETIDDPEATKKKKRLHFAIGKAGHTASVHDSTLHFREFLIPKCVLITQMKTVNKR